MNFDPSASVVQESSPLNKESLAQVCKASPHILMHFIYDFIYFIYLFSLDGG